jgi:hypothetical protein
MLQSSIIRQTEETEKRPESVEVQEMDVKLDPVISMDETDDENENKEEEIDKREKWQPDIFTVFDVVGEKREERRGGRQCDDGFIGGIAISYFTRPFRKGEKRERRIVKKEEFTI